MATITPYQTKAGRRWRVRYRKPNRQQTDKRGFTTKRDAQIFAASVEVSKTEGSYVDPTRAKISLAEYSKHWLNTVDVKKQSRRIYETALRVHVIPYFGDMYLSQITRKQIREWVAIKARERAGQTVIRAHYVLQATLQLAFEDKLIYENPARGLKNLPKKAKRKRVYLTYVQVEQAAALANQHRYAAMRNKYGTMIYQAAYVGLRWSEIQTQTVFDVDLKARRIRVRAEVAKNGTERIVGYPDFLHDMYVKLVADSIDGRLYPPMSKPKREKYNWFDTMRNTLNLPERFVFHDLRHTAASFAVSAGASVKVVQNMLGHASAVETLDTYADLFDTDVDDVAARISVRRAESLEKCGQNVGTTGFMSGEGGKRESGPQHDFEHEWAADLRL